jgi:hypothetical protein
MQHWNISTEDLKDIRHPVLSMRGSDTLPVFFEGRRSTAAVDSKNRHGVDTVCEPRLAGQESRRRRNRSRLVLHQE